MRPLAAVLCLLLLIACGGGAPPPDPVSLIQGGAEILDATEGFTFRISRDGEPAEVGGWLIRGLGGEYQAPDAVNARVKVKVGGLIVEAGIVSIGDRTWQQDPLTGEWTLLGQDVAITVAPVFGSDGLSAVISNDLSDVSYVETATLDDLPGERLHHLTVTLDAARLNRISSDLIEDGVKIADLYFAENGELRRVAIPDATGTWLIDAWDYGPGHVVEPPA